ncbi:hypothetical protein AJ80_08604 [Polytolypa hystricis UAMH7299]|uniref:Hypercellular protein HypA n=1 Tax=Polytolypa hystricis (strain UAMH7299) TaxID=1447883 RepID=A0A2B7X589_POLH7|nr:hypothetical protein AJ80_08604 [Polytolypa hystricis UAMH7299]
MAVDPLSPIAPARLRVLLLPIGKIRRSRFLELAKRLQAHNVIRLGDVSPDGRANRNQFSPLAFPSGMVVYDLSISVPPLSHLELFPFETFREPLAIIAIADGTQLEDGSESSEAGSHPNPKELEDLLSELHALKETYPRSLACQLVVFDSNGVDKLVTGPEEVTWVPRPEASSSTTMKTVMCDITSVVLGALGKFAEAMQEWPAVESPKASSWGPRRAIEPRPIDKLQHRMTMPAQLPSRPNGQSNSLSGPDYPSKGHESPTTFDEITRSIQLANRATAALRSSSKPGSKEHSRDRMSTSGIGSVAAGDRNKTRIKGRLSIVLGNLFLQAGRWPDALKELVEGATIARGGSDYVWHAKGLELILLCLLMFGWAGMDFQIPQICYPSADKPSKSSTHTPSMSNADLYGLGQSHPESRAVSLQNLVNLLPDISNHILHLYTRAANITDEALPQLVFSETVIRLAGLLTAAHVRDGILDDNSLRHIVMNEPLTHIRYPDRPRGSLLLRKPEMATFVFRALPPSLSSDLPITDSVPILVGIASVLSTLGLDRKRALVLKELLSIMVVGLVQARKIGAAEMGIHPAAGLSALNNTTFDINALDLGPGNMEESMRTLLALAGRTYGVQRTTDCLIRPTSSSLSSPTTPKPSLEDDSADAIVERVFRHAALNVFGDQSLKIEILRACINFCEALPDFEGVLQFTVDLLHTIKRTFMLLPGGFHRGPSLAPDEQVRLLNNVKRTVSAAHRLGASHLEADYWDDFLVRGVELVEHSGSKEPFRRSKSEFGVAVAPVEAREKSPFIYNPFAKSTTKASESLLIAKEPAVFKITLQNPFEFDVEIESLRLEGTGVPFEAVLEGIWLAPFSLQDKYITGVASAEGTLNITGCMAKVKFCRERRFPIFKKSWKPELEPKLKRLGLAAKEPASDRPLSWTSMSSGGAPRPVRKGPEPDTLEVKVIRPQPTLTIQSTSLSQSALMILEGEIRTFEITLQNDSPCPADTVLFTFQDSAAEQLQYALNNKDNLPADVYELELQLSMNPALRWRPDPSKKDISIAAGDSQTFTIEIFGKPGLHDAVVQINYANVGVPLSEMPENFYTRQLSLPLAVTVNASVDVARCDVLPFSGDLAWSNKFQQPHLTNGSFSPSPPESSTPRSISQIKDSEFASMLSRTGPRFGSCDHCLLLLDLRNAWPSPLSISLSVNEPTAPGDGIADTKSGNLSVVQEVVDELQPGHVSRFVVLVPRAFLHDPHKAIPSLNAGNKRQFVVSGRQLTFEAEAAARENFWFREKLLKHLRGSWREDSTGREGMIELRNIRINPRMVEALRIDDVEVSFSLHSYEGQENDGDSDAAVTQTGHSRFSVKPNTFLSLRVTILNRTSKPIHPLLRLQPSLRNQPHSIALDLSKRLAWTGMLQRALPVLGAGQTTQASIGITALCRGEYEIGASVEEIRHISKAAAADADADTTTKESVGQRVEDDEHEQAIRDAFDAIAPRQRRVWHSRVPCTISATD